MNKTVTINISGIIFHIEEDAYEKLGNYLRTIRSRFTEEEGRDEIMADIEARIAEILQQRVGPSKQVVVMADVDHVIELMGQPEVISDKEEKTEEQPTREEERFEHDARRRRRRLFRDTDDKVIGGVCSGLGYYFDIDPVWLRIGFAAIFLAFGSGLLFYLLLLIIIPKAETTAEKLEMRGEPVDVNNISRTIREEFEGFKRRMEDFGEEAKEYGRKWKNESKEWKRKHYRGRGSRIEDFFRGVFHLIGRIFAFALIFFGILLLIGLLTSTFSLSDLGPDELGDNVRSLFHTDFQYGLALVALLLVFGIPILMMIYKGIRLLFRIKRPDRIVGITALCLWIAGIGAGVYSVTIIASAFAEVESTHETFAVANPHVKHLTLKVKIDPDMENREYNSRMNRKYRYERRYKAVHFGGDSAKFGYPRLRIIPSESDSIELVVFKEARGYTSREALDRAKAIDYKIWQQDSTITFNCFFTTGNEFWRAQDVWLELHVPKNTEVFLHSSMTGLIDDVENTSNALEEDMTDRRWMMTAQGLACVDCAGLGNDEQQQMEEKLKKEHEAGIDSLRNKH